MAKLVWFSVKWGLLLAAVVALVAVPYLMHRLDEEIRLRVEHKLATHYRHFQVRIRSAQLVEGEGILVRGVTIRDPQREGPASELLAIDELVLGCATKLESLLQGDLDLQSLTFRRATLRVMLEQRGTWSVAGLLPLPKMGGEPPHASFIDSTIELLDETKPQQSLRLRDVQLQVAPTQDAAIAPGGRSVLQVTGTLGGDQLRSIELSAIVDPTGQAWRVEGQLAEVILARELFDSLPGPRPKLLQTVDGVRATADARFRLLYHADRQPALDYEVIGTLTDGRIDDPRLAYPLTEVRAQLHCSPKGSLLKGLTARHGQAILQGQLERWGYDEASPLRFTAQARDLRLDGKLLDLLPPRWQSEWLKYAPAGEIDADLKLEFDGQSWQPEVRIDCDDISFTHHKFPYRLDHARGTITVKHGLLDCHLTARAEQAEVRIQAQLQTQQEPPIGWVEVRGDQVRFDEKLFFALPESAGDMVRSLRPTGQFNVEYRWWRDQPQQQAAHQTARLTLLRCGVKAEKFPYPIDDIQGTIELADDIWSFHDLQGVNGGAQIACSGQLVPHAGGRELLLRAAAANVPLDEELRDALSDGAQRVWNHLRPRGAMNMHVELHKLPGEPGSRIWVRAEPVGETVSIEPSAFPYRFERLRGVLELSDGRVTFDNLRAEHGRSLLTARGSGDVRPEGGWILHLEEFTWDRVQADRELLAALPSRLKKVVADLDLRGPLGLRGGVDFAAGGTPDSPLLSQWNLAVDLQQTGLTCGVRLTNVNGGVSLTGNFDGQQLRCRGEIAVDSLTWNDLQFTDVRGPLWIDDTRLLLGAWADRIRESRPERHVTARLFDGQVVTDAGVQFGPQPRYSLQAALERADLSRWARHALPATEKLQGELYAQVALRGKGSTLNDMTGEGSVQLRNADIYELPIMVSTLKLLSVVRPDKTAFTSSDIDFRLEGSHIYVDRIDFNGDAISLLGKGELQWNRQLNLTFYGVVGRDESRVPLLRNLMGGAAQQMMQIHAGGTLDAPELRREAFPGVSQAFQQLQAEFQARDQGRRLGSADRKAPATSREALR